MQLQWGRNFIVAETSSAGSVMGLYSELQWGRNFIVAETGSWPACPGGCWPRFNGAATLSLRKLLPVRGPSMQSRRFNGAATLSLRKPGSRRAAKRDITALQWGRNFIVAETGSWPACPGGCWPRFNGAATLSLRKLLPVRGPSMQSRRFNGAATLSLRKPGSRRAAKRDITALQWGRNFIVAETRILRITPGAANRTLQWGRNFIVAETVLIAVYQ